MVLRITGTGQKFYGCSRYPKCKATSPFKDENNSSAERARVENPLIEYNFPRLLRAREKFQGYQNRFFESVAVSENLLEKLNLENIGEEILKAFSQWRIDFPTRELEFKLTEQQRQIISVAEKILTRGRITLSSHIVEEELKQVFKSSIDEFSLSYMNFLVIRGYEKEQKNIWLDSKEESIFYEDILPKLLGQNYEQFVLPQVEISSLLSLNLNIDRMRNQRVDFAIFHPALEKGIIVEIDGEQHKSHADSDKERDKILQEHGYVVIRIPANEIQKRSGQQLSALKSKLSVIEERFDEEEKSSYNEIIKFMYSIKFAHQIQLILLQAIQSGFLNLEDKRSWHIVADLDEIGTFGKKEALVILKKSVAGFVDLLGKLSKLYSIELNIGKPICNLISDRTVRESTNAIYISFSDRFATHLPTFYVQNIYFPFHIANSSFPAPPIIGGLNKPQEKDLEYFLQYLFRKPYFWEGQYDGIVRALQGKDALILLPTGAGKSLVYQLASLLLPGRTVVIDPIISLMEDQIDNLSMIGIDRCIAITSQIRDTQDRLRAIQLFGQGEYLFAYVAPERFQTIEFRESLRELTVHTPIALIVVDEAHCVSEWGHDFRTAYLNIGRTSRNYCKTDERVPPLLALTGTASRSVLKDVQRELQIEDFDAIITPKSFDRSELKFRVLYSESQEKLARLKGYLGQTLPGLFNTTTPTFYQTKGGETYSGLVFCPHVDGEFGIERIADNIEKELNIPTAIYSGKEPKYWSPEQYYYHKQRTTKEFKKNKIPLLVCTKSFGMGINKPNIRYTIHLGIPPSIESFYQEAGRAGRNRRTAHCCIIVSNDDPGRSKKLLDPNTKVEEIDEIVRNIPWEENDDITRVLYFHINSFRGVDKEKRDVEEVLRLLGDISKKGTRTLTLPNFERNTIEKALHRLLLIGVVSDYTINYSREEFTVKLSGANKEEILEAYGKYVASYFYSRKQVEIEKASQLLFHSHQEFIVKMISLLLHFIYDVIERGRRRAIYEMLLACENFSGDNTFRQRILQYLEATKYSEKLEQIINDKDVGIAKCRDIFDIVCSLNDASELRGQVSRYLESYPDHPTLLMLRSLSEIYSKDKNSEVVSQNFIASISSLLYHGVSRNIIPNFIVWALEKIKKRDGQLANELLHKIIEKHPSRSFLRILIENLPIEFAKAPAWFLLESLEHECKTLIL